ncbi:metal-dependent hydrolase [Candidatus Dependentiae bacterium]|nr:metal-dependent hydrolase [Candidatus Dependentiae bacterium]
MQTLAHIQYGWLLANIDKDLNLTERRLITLAAFVPDIDSIAQLFGTDAFYNYHHIVLHNFLTMFIYLVIAFIFTRRIKVLALTALSFLLHLGTDYVTSDWPLQLFYPFSKFEVTLEEFIPSEIIISLLQPIFAYGIIIATIIILIKYRRTFIEAFSKNLDILLINFALLPFKNRCAFDQNRALYKCSECGKTLCAKHRYFIKGLKVICPDCKKISVNSVNQTENR